MSVRPLYQINNATYKEGLYRNASAKPKYSVALGYSGDNQTQLVARTSDDPHIYKDFLDDDHDGLMNQMCLTVENMDEFRRSLDTTKFETLAQLALEPAGHVLHLRGAGQQCPLIEVGGFPPAIYQLFDRIKSAAERWDGRDLIRSI